MSTSKAVVVVGRGGLAPQKHYSASKRIAFDIQGFKHLEKKRYQTSFVACHGYSWSISVHPWGDYEKAKAEEKTSIFVQCRKGKEQAWPEVKFSIAAGGKTVTQEYTYDSLSGNVGRGWTGFAKRSDLISKTNAMGTLVFHVDIQIATKKECLWYPQTTLQQKMEQLYHADKDADVTFVFPSGELVHAHQFVLNIQSPTLSEIAREAEDGKVNIDQANPDLFAIMIRSLYFGSDSLPSSFSLTKDGIKLLELANTFGCVDLKMTLETKIVDSGVLTKENAAEMLLLADGNVAALLKEAAMDVIVNNPLEIMQSEGWKALQESKELLAEAFQALARGPINSNPENSSVSVLRKRLADKELDFDGTKEMLVKRLKAAEVEES